MKKRAMVAALVLAGFSGTVIAHNAGDFFIRLGTATVRTDVRSDEVLPNTYFSVDNNTQAGITFTYMVTDNVGIELLAATPFRHQVGLTGNGTIATVHHLPPTLMAQWYIGNGQNALRPYAGIGVNYTTFFDNSFNDGNQAVNALKLNSLRLDDSWGFAMQAGMDYRINKNWLLNMSVWYMDISTKVKFNAGATPMAVKTRLDPWVFMFSAGYRF